MIDKVGALFKSITAMTGKELAYHVQGVRNIRHTPRKSVAVRRKTTRIKQASSQKAAKLLKSLSPEEIKKLMERYG